VYFKAFFISVLLGGLSLAQDRNPFAGNAKETEAGRVMFRMACAGCHGLHAKGGRGGPDLTRGSFRGGDTDADLYRVIAGGVPGTEMPSFRDNMDTEMLWRLVAYVRTLPPSGSAKVDGDRAAGEQLFWGKGNCGQCHRVGTRGSSIGPDLSRSGRQRSVAYLRESVIAPDADITDGYATIVVVTRDGKKIEGVSKGLDNFSARLLDLSGKFHSYMKDQVTSVTREERSLMPSYSRVFTARELNDLVAYLAGLGDDK
jgi:cytochrome c oxidase cbb3-type subunit III